MPTFTAITLDRLIDPGATRMSPSTGPAPAAETDKRLERRNSTPSRMTADEDDLSTPLRSRRALPPRSRLAKQDSIPIPETTEKKAPPQWPQIFPALYATPETTPSLPDSPTSPSPYVINHKRRGPRLQLQKSSSDSSSLTKKILDENLVNNGHLVGTEVERKPSMSEDVSSGSKSIEESESNGYHHEEEEMSVNVNGNENGVMAGENGVHKVELAFPRPMDRESESEDFFDPNDSMSLGSYTDGDDFSGERSGRTTTPMGVGEFFDACEELSSDNGYQSQSSRHDLETELREMRLSLLMEIEKRKQAEDTLNSFQNQWQVLRRKLREVGLVLPELPSPMTGHGTADVDYSAEEICQQVNIARIVSESIGRGVARAECEEEMEAQIERKQFEIARLCDRLHYYETMNREMTQRNQEAIELARRGRQKWQRMQKWIWGSVAASITLGTAALAWSYVPTSKGPSSSNHSQSPESGSQSK